MGIIWAVDGKEGFENILIKITLDVFLGVLKEISSSLSNSASEWGLTTYIAE